MKESERQRETNTSLPEPWYESDPAAFILVEKISPVANSLVKDCLVSLAFFVHRLKGWKKNGKKARAKS